MTASGSHSGRTSQNVEGEENKIWATERKTSGIRSFANSTVAYVDSGFSALSPGPSVSGVC